MHTSDFTEEQLMALSEEEKRRIVCGGIRDEGESAEIALLLGGRPVRSEPRARAAARLYHAGRIRKIVPTGGVLWDVNGEKISEAAFMKRILMSEGVPEDAIFPEEQATTTKENMICATLQIQRSLGFRKCRIMIITSLTHMRRSLVLARNYLPRFAEICYYPTCPEASETTPDEIDKNLHLMLCLVDDGMTDGYDF